MAICISLANKLARQPQHSPSLSNGKSGFNLTKNQLLEFYLNHVYFGNRCYGVAAASKTYFAKPITELNLAEATMLAGTANTPSSSFNPFKNLARAQKQQQRVLKRMLQAGYITEQQAQAAKQKELKVNLEFTLHSN